MESKTLATCLLIIIGILLFPLIIGAIAGVFGVFGSILGAIFGAIGGLFGMIFGLIGSVFGAVFGLIGWIFDFSFPFHGDVPRTIALVLIAVVIYLIVRSRKQGYRR